MKDTPPARLRLYLDALEDQGYLRTTSGDYPVLHLCPKAAGVLFHGEKVTMTERAATAKEAQAGRREQRRKTAARAAAVSAAVDEGLMGRLKELRTELAQKQHVPAYVIFSNATLAAMAAQRPRTTGDFLRLPGVGDAKARRYGQAFLKLLAEYRAEEEARQKEEPAPLA